MELTFLEQSTAFAYSLILGAVLGSVYGLFKIFRTAFCSGKASTFICDFLFMLLSAAAIFYFSTAFLYGYIRVYVFIGCAAGFFIYRASLGRLFSKIYCPLIITSKKISRKIQGKIKNFTKKLLKIAYKILYNIFIKVRVSGNKCFFALNKRVMTANEKRKGKHKEQKGASE